MALLRMSCFVSLRLHELAGEIDYQVDVFPKENSILVIICEICVIRGPSR